MGLLYILRIFGYVKFAKNGGGSKRYVFVGQAGASLTSLAIVTEKLIK
jgi:hypothetical protein